MAKRSKRGRKPHTGAREPAGRLSRAAAARVNPTGPTPEVLARRAILAGPDGDPAQTTTVLDLLYTRGAFEGVARTDAQDLWQVARRYVYCRNTLFGCPDAPALGGRQAGNEVTDGAMRWIKEDYAILVRVLVGGATVDLSELEQALVEKVTGVRLRTVQALLGYGTVKREVDSVLVYNVMPHWLRFEIGLVDRRRPGDDRHKARFLDAVVAMADAMSSHRARRKVGSILDGVTSAQEAPPVAVLVSTTAARPFATTGPQRRVVVA